MTTNDVGKYLNRANASDVQVQFTVDPAVIYHQKSLSSRNIGIGHEEVPVLAPPT